METSIRKITANARNARLSTGPRDTSRSRFNAARHGILSRDVLIRTGDGMESEEEFDQLRARMWEDLAPVGALEESLTDDLINLMWRKRRVIAYESALISQKAATARRDWEERNQVSVDLEALLGPFRRPVVTAPRPCRGVVVYLAGRWQPLHVTVVEKSRPRSCIGRPIVARTPQSYLYWQGLYRWSSRLG